MNSVHVRLKMLPIRVFDSRGPFYTWCGSNFCRSIISLRFIGWNDSTGIIYGGKVKLIDVDGIIVVCRKTAAGESTNLQNERYTSSQEICLIDHTQCEWETMLVWRTVLASSISQPATRNRVVSSDCHNCQPILRTPNNNAHPKRKSSIEEDNSVVYRVRTIERYIWVRLVEFRQWPPNSPNLDPVESLGWWRMNRPTNLKVPWKQIELTS